MPANIEPLPDPIEGEMIARIKAEEERDREKAARIEAEAEIARLKERLRRSSQG